MSVLTVPAAVRHIHGDRPGRAAIGADTLRKWAADGTVPAMLTGRGWVFATEALDEWLRTFGTHT